MSTANVSTPWEIFVNEVHMLRALGSYTASRNIRICKTIHGTKE